MEKEIIAITLAIVQIATLIALIIYQAVPQLIINTDT